MSELTIDDVLELDDSHHQEVNVPQWKDATFYIYSITANERAELEKRFGRKDDAQKDPAGFRAAVLEQSWKKKDGTPFGTKQQISDVMKKNAAAVELLFEAALEVNGFSRKDVEDLVKN